VIRGPSFAGWRHCPGASPNITRTVSFSLGGHFGLGLLRSAARVVGGVSSLSSRLYPFSLRYARTSLTEYVGNLPTFVSTRTFDAVSILSRSWSETRKCFRSQPALMYTVSASIVVDGCSNGILTFLKAKLLMQRMCTERRLLPCGQPVGDRGPNADGIL
jgi:hypothetical protein